MVGTICGYVKKSSYTLGYNNAVKETTTHQEGKVIRKREHEDGRVDVAIGIETLDVDRSDPKTAEAADILEKDVLPKVMPEAVRKLADEQVHVLVIHQPTSQLAQLIVKRREVEQYVSCALAKFKTIDAEAFSVDEFTVVVLTKPTEGTQVQVGTAGEVLKEIDV
jgi:hypothetical protein